MNNRQLSQLLRQLKNTPELGGGFEVERAWKGFASKHGFDADAAPVSYSFSDYAGYVSHLLGRHILRPVSIAASVFVFIFSGWVATVNASFDSVPGDILYPVKLVTERVQLTFASSTQQRARLHTEFAGRRLQEVVEISNSDRQDKGQLVQEAVNGFKQELASAGEQLVSLQTQAPSAAADLAFALGQKTDEYQAVLSQTESVLVQENHEAVEQALDAVEETNTHAIESLVENHEATQEVVTAERLQKNFQEEYQQVKTRVTLSVGRLSIIGNFLVGMEMNGAAAGFKERITAAREALDGHDAVLNEAMDLLAAGGYRRAFELLSEASANVAASEQIITDLEIEISTAATVSP